jgi:hypothetical protein
MPEFARHPSEGWDSFFSSSRRRLGFLFLVIPAKAEIPFARHPSEGWDSFFSSSRRKPGSSSFITLQKNWMTRGSCRVPSGRLRRSLWHLTAMDGGNAENAGAVFGLPPQSSLRWDDERVR